MFSPELLRPDFSVLGAMYTSSSSVSFMMMAEPVNDNGTLYGIN